MKGRFRHGGLCDPSKGAVVAPLGAVVNRDEIDARQHRCDQALPRPANRPNVEPLGRDGLEAITGLVTDFIVDPQISLISHEEAKAAGEAMFDRAHVVAPDVRLGMIRADSGWADMFRAGWDAIWAMRGGNGNGEAPEG